MNFCSNNGCWEKECDTTVTGFAAYRGISQAEQSNYGLAENHNLLVVRFRLDNVHIVGSIGNKNLSKLFDNSLDRLLDMR